MGVTPDDTMRAVETRTDELPDPTGDHPWNGGSRHVSSAGGAVGR